MYADVAVVVNVGIGTCALAEPRAKADVAMSSNAAGRRMDQGAPGLGVTSRAVV